MNPKSVGFKSLIGSTTLLAGACIVNAASNTNAPSYSRNIQPIFDRNCVACHQEGSAQADLNLEAGLSYKDLVSVRSTQAKTSYRVLPGNPSKSYLIAKLEGTHSKLGGKGVKMPVGNSLDARSTQMIKAWIVAGAKAK